MGYDRFALSDDGRAVLGELDGEYVDTETTELSSRRLTEVSITPSVIKRQNLAFFDDSEQPYNHIRGSRGRTRRRIKNVRNGQLDRIVRELPRFEPLPQQCAHWMRAMVGIHPSPTRATEPE